LVDFPRDCARTSRRPSMSKAETLRNALVEMLAVHEREGALPTSARFLYYELVSRGIVSRVRTGARRTDQDMVDQLTILRERGTIPGSWIADETRTIENYSGAASVRDGLLDRLPYVRIDPWRGQVPLILTESRSLARVLGNLAVEHAVGIASTNGQCGGFLRNEIAPALNANGRVLYLGDFDFAGGHIEANNRHVLDSPAGPLQWERLALTAE
jgi:hypothetical protein